jgi:hypothetical protein
MKEEDVTLRKLKEGLLRKRALSQDINTVSVPTYLS